MDRWDVLIVAVAAYVAVMTLVRLMTHRRDELVGQVRQQIDDLQKQKKATKKAKKDAA
jgi:hypothetical protein